MRVSIRGHHLPGKTCHRQDGSSMGNVHVGVQVRKHPAELIRADAQQARWEVDIEVVERDSSVDFRGPVVQGKRGDRFVYLTWGDVGAAGEFEMFRRAKLMLDRIPDDVLTAGIEVGRLIVTVDLTDDCGYPRCARVDPPAIRWSVGDE